LIKSIGRLRVRRRPGQQQGSGSQRNRVAATQKHAESISITRFHSRCDGVRVPKKKRPTRPVATKSQKVSSKQDKSM